MKKLKPQNTVFKNQQSTGMEDRRRKLEAAQLENEELEAELKRRELDVKRRRLDADDEEAKVAERTRQKIVNLNVGGRFFTTSRDTLLAVPTSIFKRFFPPTDDVDEGDGAGAAAPFCPPVTDAEGRIFIDRDGELFHHVLAACRGQFGPEVSDMCEGTRHRLIDEFEYFGLFDHFYFMKSEFNPLELSEEDQRLQQQARINRAELIRGSGDASSIDDRFLIDAFRNREAFSFDEGGLSGRSGEIALLFEKLREQWQNQRPSPPPASEIVPENIEGFRERLHLFSGPLLAGVLEAAGEGNFVIAGGAVLRALCCMGDPSSNGVKDEAREGSSDIDIFVISDSEDGAKEVFERIYSALRAACASVSSTAARISPEDSFQLVDEQGLPRTASARRDDGRDLTMRSQHMLVTRSRYAITFVTGWPQRHIQLVLRRYSSVAEVRTKKQAKSL
jgi:hypothetical protein